MDLEQSRDLEHQVRSRDYEVYLAAGELLYIPPYWFHRVAAPRERASLSVNVWSESEEGELRGLVDVPP